MAGINEGIQYLKSVPCILKILEIVSLLVGIGAVGYFWNNWGQKDNDDFAKHDYIKCFLAATATAWIIALLFFLLFVAGLHKKINVFNWAKMAGFIFILLAILMLVVSGLLADSVKYYNDDKVLLITSYCKIWEHLDSQCDHLITGTVCGFFAGVIFLVDGIIHFKL